MVTFFRSFAIIGAILGVHAVAIASGWYTDNLWFDIPMHFSGGFAMGFLGLAIWEALVVRIAFKKSTSSWLRLATQASIILGFVALVGIAWEWYEFIFDSYASHVSLEFRPAQMGLGDTMADFFFDLSGGLLAFVLFRRR
jgi:hypothetical protein